MSHQTRALQTLLLLSLACAAHAQQPAPGVSPTVPTTLSTRTPEADQSPWSVNLSGGGSHQFRTDLRNGNGSFQVSRAQFGAGISYRLNSDLTLNLDSSTEVSWYDFRNAITLFTPVPNASSTAKPFHTLYQTSINPGFRYLINKEWFVIGGGIFQFAGENKAKVGDSFTAGGFLGVGYRIGDSLTLTGGIIASSRIEDNAFVAPLIGITWKINEKFTLQSRGLGAELSYTHSEQLAFFADVGYESREYRLSDRNFLPEGIVRDKQIPVGLGLRWSVCPNFDLTLRGGLIAYQQFTIDDKNGNRINRLRSDPTGFIGIKGEIKF